MTTIVDIAGLLRNRIYMSSMVNMNWLFEHRSTTTATTAGVGLEFYV